MVLQTAAANTLFHRLAGTAEVWGDLILSKWLFDVGQSKCLFFHVAVICSCRCCSMIQHDIGGTMGLHIIRHRYQRTGLGVCHDLTRSHVTQTHHHKPLSCSGSGTLSSSGARVGFYIHRGLCDMLGKAQISHNNPLDETSIHPLSMLLISWEVILEVS